MTSTTEQASFDKSYVDAYLDTLINYLQACQVEEYSLRNHEGWTISLKKKVKG